MSNHPFSAGRISCHNRWLLEIIFTKNSEINLEDLLEISEFRQQNVGNNLYCSLIDIQKDFLIIDAEAKKFSATNENIQRLRVAEAILVQSLGQQLGASLYIRLFKSNSKRRVFMNRESAISWLEKRYKKANQEVTSQQ